MFGGLGHFGVIFFLLAGVLHAELRTFTNESGQSIKAELLELKEEGSVISLRLENRRQLDAKVSAFSEADQKHIQEWWEGVVASQRVLHSGARVRISAKMNRRSRRGDYTSWYTDDQIRSFFPEVVINNTDLQTFTGNTVRLVVFGEDRRNPDQLVVVSATDLKADFEGRAETTLEGDPFRLRNYEYRGITTRYRYGYDYDGFAVIIRNSEGEVTHERASRSKYLNHDLIFKCKAREVYDIRFERKLNVSPSSFYFVSND